MRRAGSIVFLLSVFFVALASCAQENAPAFLDQSPTAATTSTDGGLPTTTVGACMQAHAESLPARLVAMSTSVSSSSATPPILVSDLNQEFQQICGSCHGSNSVGQGGFQITGEGTFTEFMTSAVIAHVIDAKCPNPPDPGAADDPMPPCDSPDGLTYTARSKTNDPVYQFSNAVLEWLAAGKPASFTPSAADGGAGGAGGDAGTVSSFMLSPQDGNAMTNIGNCVPSAGSMWLQMDKAMAMDAKFAAAQTQASGTPSQVLGLPPHLSDTDLFTLDSATLAQYGVVAYAPGYPLWSDDAGKLRYVRVPVGQSIHFDKATQKFEIPPNTRFYKTFMKEIIDTDGSLRYRKIETRLIVSRPDNNNPDGTAANATALFGTYLWRADESEADLVQTPLRSGEPFSDTLLLYNTNEPLAADILTGQPAEPDVALVTAGAARHYAVPGSARCQECHMGSASESFVLGFAPLQINRFPLATHGVIEATGPDELTQLQRFIDYGVITGIQSLDDVLPLEQSQGSRTPRNHAELTAQGYVLGNCSHCHNPRGYPSVTNPVLTCVLDFLPSSYGGIFQFPLERYSPRIGRGPTGTELIPYITPSLVDLPRVDSAGNPAADVFVVANAGAAHSAIYAPWRSIIYRNADSTFAYVDDLALYPHMPMNTPGYDPRAKAILSDWMVSIPAVRKRPDLVEYAYQTDSKLSDNIPSGAVTDTSPQPYVEVQPGSPDYAAAELAAATRLSILHTGTDLAGNTPVQMAQGSISYTRYDDQGQTNDILDPEVLENPICTPVPQGDPLVYTYPFPEHPHWVVTDLSNPPPPWTPRQPNWPEVLVQDQVPPLSTSCTSPTALISAHTDEETAVGLLPGITLEQANDYLTTPRPFGLWQQQAGCNFSGIPTVADFAGAQRPHWMDVVNPPSNAPVYMEIPGAAIFKMICINCHGPAANATGRLAQNLATMTGGAALVADFRDGLFGPTTAASNELSSNRHAQFGVNDLPSGTAQNPQSAADWIGTASNPITDDDRASRYMAWMGLGGTSVNIPIEILQIVAVTKVLDQQRVISSSQLSANMLSEAKALCLSLLGPGVKEAATNSDIFSPAPGGNGYLDANKDSLNFTALSQNGDLELWLGLCSRNNPQPVHIMQLQTGSLTFLPMAGVVNAGTFLFDTDTEATNAMVTAATYPPLTAVGNDRGGVDTNLCVDPTTCCLDTSAANCSTLCSLPGQANCVTPNDWPWCIDPASIVTPAQVAGVNSSGYPVCPQSVMTVANGCGSTHGTGCVTTAYGNQWAVRGAINAGLAVFKYVESMEPLATPPPDYNQCSELPGSVVSSAGNNTCLTSSSTSSP